MVAYSFKKRFAEPILAGSKSQTIRAPRRRHARPGEQLQLYTGMRTKQCKLIARSECVGVDDVELWFDSPTIIVNGQRWGISKATRPTFDDFARRDGFSDWDDMRAFWRAEHPNAERFTGVLIRWRPITTDAKERHDSRSQAA